MPFGGEGSPSPSVPGASRNRSDSGWYAVTVRASGWYAVTVRLPEDESDRNRARFLPGPLTSPQPVHAATVTNGGMNDFSTGRRSGLLIGGLGGRRDSRT